jgi:2-succinyl-6-hydroxy-2,4-cyclohexadiene-1-carboxylate synthase
MDATRKGESIAPFVGIGFTHPPCMARIKAYDNKHNNMTNSLSTIRNIRHIPTERRRIEVRGLHMAVEQVGQQGQTPLVLLHGFTGSTASWSELLASLVALGLRVVSIDMPGHGQSDAPVEPARYTIEQCQSDIVKILRTLGIAPGEAILLGYSMGGRIALYTALGGFFRALILESASPGIADAGERERRRLSDDALAQRIEQEGVAAFVTYWEQLPLFASQQTLPKAQQAALHQQRLSNRAEGLANSLRGVGTGSQPALHEQLATLTIPTLLIAGELDGKYCAIAQDMAQRLPHSQLAIIPGAGHTAHLEQPDTFIKLIANFCTEI